MSEVLKGLQSVTIGLPVPDLHHAVAWYQQLIGRPPDLEPAPGVAEFELTPRCWLQLLEGKKQPGQGNILRVGVTDLNLACEHLRQMGIEPGPIRRVEGVVAYCGFSDPFGNQLSLYQVLG